MKSPIAINEILDISVSFLNDHLEETLSLTENRKKITQTYKPHTGKCFIPIPNHKYVMI